MAWHLPDQFWRHGLEDQAAPAQGSERSEQQGHETTERWPGRRQRCGGHLQRTLFVLHSGGYRTAQGPGQQPASFKDEVRRRQGFVRVPHALWRDHVQFAGIEVVSREPVGVPHLAGDHQERGIRWCGGEDAGQPGRRGSCHQGETLIQGL